MSERLLLPAPEIRVSIAVGAALLVQTALGLIWAGGAAVRIADLERRADATNELIERTARLEEQVGAMRASLNRIEAKLDRKEDGR
ncbi:MAG: hypothetical protein GC153_07350 [Alphaproteobacteria bacterium]|nr:hypothetical protein [Alphaproteobacteria bacterium]